MKKIPLAARAAAAAVLASTALGASAGVQVLTQNGFANAGTPTTITVAGGPNSGTHYAGEFSGVFGGDSFLSYCVDLRQFFSFGTPYLDYAVTTGGTLFGTPKALQLGEFLTAVGGFSASTPSRSAAVQAGLWEILYETGPTLALTGGTFTAMGGTTLASDIAAVNGFLSHLGDYAAMPFSVFASPTAQDFITAGGSVGRLGFGVLAVPEPSSLVLIALALAAAVPLHRRRRRRA